MKTYQSSNPVLLKISTEYMSGTGVTEHPVSIWCSIYSCHAEYNEMLSNNSPATIIQQDIMVIVYL